MNKGIQAIINLMGEDAARDGAALLARAKGEIDRQIEKENALYLEEMNKRCDALARHYESEIERNQERLENRVTRELLLYQHELVEEIFALAAAKLRGISPEAFVGMFRAAAKGLKGNLTLYLGERSAGMIQPRDVEEATRGTGLRIALGAETVPGKSGFLLADDRVEYNCLFEDLIEDKKEGQTASIIKEVFG